MDFPFGATVYRDRRPQATDPMNPARTVFGSWEDAVTQTISNAFVADSSVAVQNAATRQQQIVMKSLYCPASSDVVVGDRIRVGSDSYIVNEEPTAPVNPFTGWQPAREIPLERVMG